MNALTKAIDGLVDVLKQRATFAFMMLAAAKHLSADQNIDEVTNDRDEDANHVFVLTYERARGILDTVQDFGYAFLGQAETDKLMRDAAKEAGYKTPSEANKYSVHAAANLAKHPPSRPDWQNRSKPAAQTYIAGGAGRTERNIYGGGGHGAIVHQSGRQDSFQPTPLDPTDSLYFDSDEPTLDEIAMYSGIVDSGGSPTDALALLNSTRKETGQLRLTLQDMMDALVPFGG